MLDSRHELSKDAATVSFFCIGQFTHVSKRDFLGGFSYEVRTMVQKLTFSRVLILGLLVVAVAVSPRMLAAQDQTPATAGSEPAVAQPGSEPAAAQDGSNTSQADAAASVDQAVQEGAQAVDQAAEQVQDAARRAEERLEQAGEETKRAAEDAKDAMSELKEKARKVTKDALDQSTEFIQGAEKQVNAMPESAKISAGILDPIYKVAERLNFPAFHWLAFAVMMAGVVCYALQLVLGKLVVLAHMSFSVTEFLSDLLCLVISIVGLVLTTQAAAENSTFTQSHFMVITASVVGLLLGLRFYLWGQSQELRALQAERFNKVRVTTQVKR